MKVVVLFVVVYFLHKSSQFTTFEELQVDTSEWLLKLIDHIQQGTQGTMDIVIVPASDAKVKQMFNKLRHTLGLLTISKYEGSINTEIKRKVLFLFDGTNALRLKKSLESLRNRPRALKNLANLSTQYLVAVVNSSVTTEHEIAFKATIACHMILVDISTGSPRYYRLTPADKRRLTLAANASAATVLDDRRDWAHYEVRIQADPTRHLYARLVLGKFIGLDKAAFDSARIRYRFVVASTYMTYSEYRAKVEGDLANRKIDLIISGNVFRNPFAEELHVYDKTGLCLVLPKSLSRNVVYHLVHPFQIDIWMLVFTVIFLDILLARFFPKKFPQNLVMILLFGDPIFDHQQLRWTRFYCFACSVLLFLLSEAYLAKVIRYMTVTRYTPDMRTLSDVLDSDLQFKVPVGTKQYIAAEEIITNIHRNMLGKMIEVEDFRYDRLDNGYGYMVTCLFAKTLLEQHIRQEIEQFGHRAARRKFYLLEEMLDWSRRYYAVAKHFTFYGKLRLVTSRVYEAGLWNKWMADFGTKASTDSPSYALWDENDILGLEDIVAIWYLIGTGWTIAGGVLLLELIWFRMSKIFISARFGRRFTKVYKIMPALKLEKNEC